MSNLKIQDLEVQLEELSFDRSNSIKGGQSDTPTTPTTPTDCVDQFLENFRAAFPDPAALSEALTAYIDCLALTEDGPEATGVGGPEIV